MSFEFILRAITVYVVARILTKEEITSWLRAALLLRSWFMLEKLFSCPFCMSFYVATALCLIAPTPGIFIVYEVAAYMFATALCDRVLSEGRI